MHHAHHGMHHGTDNNEDALQNDHALPEAKNQEFCVFAGLNLDDASSLYIQSVNHPSLQTIIATRLEGVRQSLRFRLFRSRAPPKQSFI